MAIIQSWPAGLADERATCMAAVAGARCAVQAALSNGAGCYALAQAGAACADCLRLCVLAGEYRPASGRWSPRLLALRELVEQHATYGHEVASAGLPGALGEVLLVLADLQYYLVRLGAAHDNRSFVLVAGDN